MLELRCAAMQHINSLPCLFAAAVTTNFSTVLIVGTGVPSGHSRTCQHAQRRRLVCRPKRTQRRQPRVPRPLRAPAPARNTAAAVAQPSHSAHSQLALRRASQSQHGDAIVAKGVPGATVPVEAPPMNDFLAKELETHPELVRGTLANGFEYVILPNRSPPGRFEAHLQMHVGSVDEHPDEQVGPCCHCCCVCVCGSSWRCSIDRC